MTATTTSTTTSTTDTIFLESIRTHRYLLIRSHLESVYYEMTLIAAQSDYRSHRSGTTKEAIQARIEGIRDYLAASYAAQRINAALRVLSDEDALFDALSTCSDEIEAAHVLSRIGRGRGTIDGRYLTFSTLVDREMEAVGSTSARVVEYVGRGLDMLEAAICRDAVLTDLLSC